MNLALYCVQLPALVAVITIMNHGRKRWRVSKRERQGSYLLTFTVMILFTGVLLGPGAGRKIGS